MGRPPRSILVITYGGHGDILLTTPLIASLKRAFPAAMIDVYTQQGRGTMLAGNPDVRSVLESKHRHGLRSYSQFFLHHTLRYDLAVSARKSDRQVLFARMAGRRALSMVPGRGENRFWKEMIVTGSIRKDERVHEVFQILWLADLIGIEKSLACRPPSDPSSDERLHSLIPFDWTLETYAVLNLTPRNRYKEWTVQGWTKLVRHLHSKGLQILLIGGSSAHDVDYAANLTEHEVSCGMTDLTGKTTFADAAVLLERCRLYVGLDTAMTHLAAVLETPTVALYGWANPRYMPYHAVLSAHPYRLVSPQRLSSDHVHVVIGQCECRPGEPECEQQSGEYSDCMRSISPALVTATVDAILDRELDLQIRGGQRVETEASKERAGEGPEAAGAPQST